MRQHVSVLWTLGGLQAAAALGGCGDDGAADRLDASFGRDLDAGFDTPTGLRDASRYDALAANAPPVLKSATPAACASEPLSPFGASCALPDPGEPSTVRKPARLELGTTCNVLQAWTADKEEDAYRFEVARADPVRVELSYESSTRAELSAVIRADGQREVARTAGVAQAATQSAVFQGTAGQSYDIGLEGRLLGTCLPYALRVDANYCTDAYEDNDSESSATKLPRPTDATPVLELQGTASAGDMDFFEFTTPKADPVQISGSYTVSADASLQLRRIVVNTAGLGSLDVAGARVGLSETFSHWLASNSAGAVFRAQLWPTGTGCAQYALRFDVAACTDAYEDNDLPEAAAPLRLGAPLQASAFRGDDDYYDLSSSTAGGTCTASYTLADGSAQLLRLTVFNGGSMIAASTPPATGSSAKAVSVSWQRTATVLSVSAGSGDACQPYSLRCDVAASAPVQ